MGSVTSFVAVVLGGCLVLPALVLGRVGGGGIVQVALLALVVAGLALSYRLLLGPAADLLEERSERLAAALEGKD